MGSPILKSEKTRLLLSKNIQALLAQHEWSENELARRSGVSQKQVNNIVMQRTGCGIDALDAIARAFACEPFMLLVPAASRFADNPSRPARFLLSYLQLSPAEREHIERQIKHLSDK